MPRNGKNPASATLVVSENSRTFTPMNIKELENKRIAVLLSGGVDSSVVVYEFARLGLHPDCFYIKIGPEEQEEWNCDEWGYCNDSYDQLHHCGWCKEVYPESDLRHEVDFGWICSRCEAELKSHGGPLTFVENEELDK